MDTPHQFQSFPYYNPNPSPILDLVANEHDHTYRDRSPRWRPRFLKDVADYLMSDESLDPKEIGADLSRNKNIVVDDHQSSSSAFNIKHRRIVKKYKEKQELRVAFRTKSNIEIMDDGFKWTKYGKKMIKSSPNHPRNYFKCSSGGCCVKKRVERDGNDSKYVITTYQGVHNHDTPNSHVLYCTPHSLIPNFN